GVGATAVDQCTCLETLHWDSDSASCLPCPEGSTFVDGSSGVGLPCICDAGLYMEGSECLPCPTHTHKSFAGNELSMCLPCPHGSTSAENVSAADSLVCSVCPQGTYGGDGNDCVDCPPGTYSEGTGLFSADMCTVCPKGFYGEGPRMTSAAGCLRCPANTYTPSGSLAASINDCIPCPIGQSSDDGTTICTESTGNTRRLMIAYLITGVSTLTAIALGIWFWQRKVRQRKCKSKGGGMRLSVPKKMALAKRKTVIWALLF
ncbi:unnamed protein product, partial [Chrysoparadoxa australica]